MFRVYWHRKVTSFLWGIYPIIRGPNIKIVTCLVTFIWKFDRISPYLLKSILDDWFVRVGSIRISRSNSKYECLNRNLIIKTKLVYWNNSGAVSLYWYINIFTFLFHFKKEVMPEIFLCITNHIVPRINISFFISPMSHIKFWETIMKVFRFHKKYALVFSFCL